MKYPYSFLCILLLFASCTNFYFCTTKKDGGVHFFRMLKVNDSHQAVLVRGNSKSNPLLVFMHGGPGFPLMPFEPNENTFRYLERHFTLGRHDVIVSSRLAAEYFNVLNAPAGKELIWFESSAHRPHSEEQEKFLSVMQQIRNDHYKEQQQPAD